VCSKRGTCSRLNFTRLMEMYVQRTNSDAFVSFIQHRSEIYLRKCFGLKINVTFFGEALLESVCFTEH
jgi:hypothetical protein